MNEEKIEEGMLITEEEEFWIKRMREVASDSIKSIEEAGKQLIGIITVMEGIYAAVLAFSGIKVIPKGNMLAAVIYISPVFLWLISLFFALRVFKTQRYHYYSNSPDSSKQAIQKIADFKHKNLNIAYTFLCISFVIAAAGIIYWLYKGGA